MFSAILIIFCIEGGWRFLGLAMPSRSWRSPIQKSLSYPKACSEACGLFQKKIETCKAEGKPLVFCDESRFAQSMSRPTDIQDADGAVLDPMIGAAKGRTNAIGALLGKTLLTVSLIVGTVNTAIFKAWWCRICCLSCRPNPLWSWTMQPFIKEKTSSASLNTKEISSCICRPLPLIWIPLNTRWPRLKNSGKKPNALSTTFLGTKKYKQMTPFLAIKTFSAE